ncbi:MAG: hypothetical protein OES79_09355, partial [Planctomycetota bacterium]|nr:hypothetical protein [Planctomycetota bacterium]
VSGKALGGCRFNFPTGLAPVENWFDNYQHARTTHFFFSIRRLRRRMEKKKKIGEYRVCS